MPVSNYLIYLAHGPAGLQAEAIYSLLSYYRVAAQPAQVLVYTDAPARFRQVLGECPGLHFPAVTAAEWQQWRGRSQQPYMLKISVLLHAATHYPGQLLLVDTDTIWQQDPAPLFTRIGAGEQFMHASEGRLASGNLLNRKVYQFFKGREFQVGGQVLRLTPGTVLYNSGVIGLPSTATAALHNSYQLADELFLAYNKHIMEQLALSMRLVLDGPVHEAAPYVLHYWNLKAVRPVLTQLFIEQAGRPAEELYAQAAALNLAALHEAELRYRNRPGWQRTLLKLLGRQWQLPALSV